MQRFYRQLSSLQNTPLRPDPFTHLSPYLSHLRTNLLQKILQVPSASQVHQSLSEITNYYFSHPSKQIRPVIVLLFAQATNGLGGDWETKLQEEGKRDLDAGLAELDEDVLGDWNTTRSTTLDDLRSSTRTEAPAKPLSYQDSGTTEAITSFNNATTCSPALANTILTTQLRLAQIIEMLHTASLLHDDVLDQSPLRRGAPSAPSLFGNKLSVLGGNFILGRASEALARLGDREVTELVASVLANLVDGEVLQTRTVELKDEGEERTKTSREAWNVYLQKTYLKTASLMAKGARSAVVLGGCKQGEIYKEIAYAYGRNLGIGFQLVDDVLDYEYASSTLGKPGGADLNLGLTTGPALYAWEEHPEMGELIQRKFERPGDVEMARDYVFRSSGVKRTRELAQAYVDQAKEVLASLPESEAKACLEALTERVVTRKS